MPGTPWSWRRGCFPRRLGGLGWLEGLMLLPTDHPLRDAQDGHPSRGIGKGAPDGDE